MSGAAASARLWARIANTFRPSYKSRVLVAGSKTPVRYRAVVNRCGARWLRPENVTSPLEAVRTWRFLDTPVPDSDGAAARLHDSAAAPAGPEGSPAPPNSAAGGGPAGKDAATATQQRGEQRDDTTSNNFTHNNKHTQKHTKTTRRSHVLRFPGRGGVCAVPTEVVWAGMAAATHT